MPQKSEGIPNDRMIVLPDFKKRAIDLQSYKITLPPSDIHDPPYKCYRLNLHWQPIVLGFLDWLADVASWQEAEDEDFEGIQQIIKFMRGSMCIDCGDVENCLKDSAIIASLGGVLVTPAEGDTYIFFPQQPNQPVPDEIGSQPPSGVPAGCDNDAVWSAALNVVQSTNRAVGDYFDVVEAGTNILETAAKFYTLLPFVDEALPIDVLLGLIDQFFNIIEDGYNAAYNQTLEEQIACGFFCYLLGNDCAFSPSVWLNYVWSELISTPFSFTDFSQLADFLTNGDWQNEFTVYAMFGWTLAAGKLANIIGAYVGFDRVNTWYKLGYNSPDSDWEILCACLPPTLGSWKIIYDFSGDYTPVGDEDAIYTGHGNWTLLDSSIWAADGRLSAPSEPAHAITNLLATSTIATFRAFGKKHPTNASIAILLLLDGVQFATAATINNNADVWSNLESATPVAANSTIEIRINETLGDLSNVAGIKWVELTGSGYLPQPS